MTTFATVIVLIILSLIIFAFIGVALYSIFKSEKIIVSRKERDQLIIKEQQKEKKPSKASKTTSIVFTIIGYVIVFGILIFEGFAVITNSSNNLLFIGNNANLVVASDSMSTIDSSAQLEANGGYLTDDMLNDQFQIGDILSFSKLPSTEKELLSYTETGKLDYVDELNKKVNSPYLYKVFAFKYTLPEKGESIVLHRLVEIREVSTASGSTYQYVFTGDKYPNSRQVVAYKSLLGIYNRGRVSGLGYPILFLGSAYGAYSVLGALFIIIATSYFTKKLSKLYSDRYDQIKKEKFDTEFSSDTFKNRRHEVEEKVIEAEEVKVIPKDHQSQEDDNSDIGSLKKRD
jgi:hypothetical protein